MSTAEAERDGLGRRARRIAVIAGLLPAAVGCAAVERLGEDLFASGGSCAASAPELAGLDWEAAQTVDIRIRQDEFRPMVVGLVRDQPYVLVISNGDSSSHDFRAPEFFRHAAVAQIAIDGTVEADRCVTSIEVPAKGTAEIRLVALLDGSYPFEDSSALLDLDYYEDGDGLGTIFVD